MGKDIVTGCLPVTDCVLFGGNVEISLLSMVEHVRLVIRLTASFHARNSEIFSRGRGWVPKNNCACRGIGGIRGIFLVNLLPLYVHLINIKY